MIGFEVCIPTHSVGTRVKYNSVLRNEIEQKLKLVFDSKRVFN